LPPDPTVRKGAMKIAVASGKGGTGKTTVCGALADVWPQKVQLVDLDVEEPNLHLFMRPQINSTKTAYMEVPQVDEEKCTYCGVCSDLCQFKAISVLANVILTFPEMCHGCGGCMAICPEGAISIGKRELGTVESGAAKGKRFLMGRLRVGEAMAPPLMRSVLAELGQPDTGANADVIIDCPPGVSCPAVTAVSQSDVILLVSEPTPFGLYDFKLAHEAFNPMGKPMAAVINRATLGDGQLEEYCKAHNIPILAQIPFERKAAQAYAGGELISRASDELRGIFTDLAGKVAKLRESAGEAHHA
jgi:MinD superfamily P-loop ATPase